MRFTLVDCILNNIIPYEGISKTNMSHHFIQRLYLYRLQMYLQRNIVIYNYILKIVH